jgi:hypothetical protein
MFCEPLRGWRHVTVTERRTAKDWAYCVRELVQVHYREAEQIRLVLDNLNTHVGAALYEVFPPEEARRILDRLEFHYTPKQPSWLNIAEIEIGIMNRQCLNRRMEDRQLVRREVAAWEDQRNTEEAKVRWTFTVSKARVKLKRIYPSIED